MHNEKSKDAEFIISVLRTEIFKLQNDLKTCHFTEEMEDGIIECLQKLNRAVNMIHDNFVC